MIWALVIIGFVIVILAFWGYRYFFAWQAQPWPKDSFELPSLQIHRGYWLEGAQENTLEAFCEARKRGAQMVELDVQLSKDGIPVSFHDDNLFRIANRIEKLNAFTASDLKRLFKVPSLRDVLTDTEVTPYINIELKGSGVVEAVVDVVKKCKAEGRVIFSSFNPHELRRAYKLLPQVPRALLVTAREGDEDASFVLRKMLLGGWCKAHMVNLDDKMVTEELVKHLKARKIPYAVWTVNVAERAQQLSQMQVSSVISDRFLE